MPDKIKEVFELISDKGYFSDENEFRSYVSDPKRRAEAFELIKDDGFFTDENEFNSYFGEVKKKDFQDFNQKYGTSYTRGQFIGQEPISPPISSTVSPSASKQPKSTTPSVSTGKLPKLEFQVEKPVSTQAVDNKDLAFTVESREQRKQFLGEVSTGILEAINKQPDLYMSQKDMPTMYGEKIIPAGTLNVDNIAKAVDVYAEKIKKETGKELTSFDKKNVVQSTLSSLEVKKKMQNAAMLTDLEFQKQKKLPLTAITGIKNAKGEVVKENMFQENVKQTVAQEQQRLEQIAKTPNKQISAEFKPEIEGLSAQVKGTADALNKEMKDSFTAQFAQQQKEIYNQYNQLVQTGQMSADAANAEMKQKIEAIGKQLENDTNALYAPKFNQLKQEAEEKSKEIQTRYNRKVQAQFNLEKEKASKRIQEEISKYENTLPKGYMKEYQAAFKKNLDSEINLEGLRKINQFSNLGNFEKMQTALMAGMGDVTSTVGGSLSYVGVNTGNLQNWVAQSGLYNELPMFSDDNVFDNLTNTDWWIANGVRSVPFTVATMPIGIAGGAGVGLLASALGAAKRAQVIASVIGGGFAGWEVERFLEQGAGFNDAINEGKSVSEAAEIAAAIGKYNYSTLPMNMLQMLPVFSKSFKFLGAAGIEAGAGAFEEINQGWAQAKAKAQSEGQDVSYLDYATSPQAIQEGAIGAAMSQGFTLFSLKNTPDIDKQINTLMTSIGMGGESQALEVLKTMKNNGAIDEKQFQEATNLLNYTLNAISQTENINVDDNVKSALVNRFVAIEKAKELLTENENDLASQAAKELIAEKQEEIKKILKGSEPVYLIRVVGNDVPIVSTKEQVESLLKSEKMLPLFQIEVYNDNSTKASVEEVYSKQEKEKVADVAENIPEEVQTEDEKKVEELRAAEQAEYDAMSDPNDEAAKKEIYDRYDKLITPLLGKEEAGSVGVVDNPALKDVESTSEALDNLLGDNEIEFDKLAELAGEIFPTDVSYAYHKAKEDGSNPELVKAVEELLTNKKETPASESKVGENKYEYDPKAKDSSRDIGSRADDSRAKKSDITAGTNKGESSEKADSTEKAVSESKEEEVEKELPKKNIVDEIKQEIGSLRGEQMNVRTEATRKILNAYRKIFNFPPYTGSMDDAKAYAEAFDEANSYYSSEVRRRLSGLEVASKYVIELAEKIRGNEKIESQTNKQQEDAVQEQAAGQVSVQPETKVGEGVEGGKPETESKEATEEKQEEVAKKAGISPKNLRDLYNVNRKLFGLDRVKSFASAIAMDRMIGAMAKRAGVTKAEMYGKLDFVKDIEENILKADNALFQGTINGKSVTLRNVDVDVVNGFYSNTEKALSQVKQDKMSGSQWATQLLSRGANKEEMKLTRLSDYLEANKATSISKGDIQQFLKDNRISVVEVVGSEKEGNLPESKMRAQITSLQLEGEKENYKEILVTMPNKKGKSTDAGKRMVAFRSEMDAKYGEGARGKMSESETKRLSELIELAREEGAFTEKDKFKSSHYEEPNILVHLRMNTRTAADGSKVLFLEEVQSDWGQKGREEGFSKPANTQLINQLEKQKQDILDSSKSYQFLNSKTEGNLSKEVFDAIQQVATNMIDNPYSTNESRKERFLEDIGKTLSYWESFDNSVPKMNQDELSEFYDIYTKELKNNDLKIKGYSISYRLASVENEIKEINEQIADAQEKIATPVAPFVTDTNAWVKLGLKVALKEAVAQGVDKIAWTTGEQQNERYSLEKVADEVRYSKNDDGTYRVVAYKNGENVSEDNSLREDKLEANLGKDVAQRIIDGVGEDIEGKKSLTGENLKVGGKGMKGFYGSTTEGSLGIVGEVAKSLSKQEPKTVEIEVGRKKSAPIESVTLNGESVKEKSAWASYILDYNKTGKSYTIDAKKLSEILDFHKKQLNNAVYKISEVEEFINSLSIGDNVVIESKLETPKSTQYSIDITPELKAQVEGGLALFQRQQGQQAKGAMVAADGRFVVYALTDPNISTPLHELAHVFEHYLTDAEKSAVMKAAGTKTWNIQTSEYFARGFEKYLAEGKSPVPALDKLFAKFKEWLTEIYNGIKGSDIDIKLNKKMRDIYSSMLGEEISDGKFPDNLLKIAKELDLSPQQIQNTYNKYDGSKNIEDITLEDYNKARAEGDKIKLEKSKKAFEVLLKEGSVSPTAKKKAAEIKKEVGEKTIKDAEDIMNNIDSIRQQLLDAGVIKSINCKWGK